MTIYDIHYASAPNLTVPKTGKWNSIPSRSPSRVSTKDSCSNVPGATADAKGSRISSMSSSRKSTKLSMDSENLSPMLSARSRILQSGGNQVLASPKTRGVLRNSIDIANLPPRPNQVADLSARGASCGAISRRISARSGILTERSEGVEMSPRSMRRHAIRQHRQSMEGKENREIAILSRKVESQDDSDDDPWCGFIKGDEVTTENGPDHDGPWRNMGIGRVDGLGSKKGKLSIWFQSTREMYDIKACNLKNLTDRTRSGTRMKDVKVSYLKNDDPEPERYPGRRRQRKTREPEAHTNTDCGLAAGGLANGDLVASANSYADFHVLGRVIEAGRNPGEVMVRLGDLGIRSFKAVDLIRVKVECLITDKARERLVRKDGNIDKAKRHKFTLALDEAQSAFCEEKAWQKDKNWFASEVAKQTRVKDPNEMEVLYAGDFVKVRDFEKIHPSCRSLFMDPMWSTLGIGMVRSSEPEKGTVEVQFENGGEIWTLFAGLFERIPDDQTSDRKFERTCPKKLAKRGVY